MKTRNQKLETRNKRRPSGPPFWFLLSGFRMKTRNQKLETRKKRRPSGPPFWFLLSVFRMKTRNQKEAASFWSSLLLSAFCLLVLTMFIRDVAIEIIESFRIAFMVIRAHK